MRYSEKLEKVLTDQFELLKKHKDSLTEKFITDIYKMKNPAWFINANYRIPEIGDKLTMYFYLFIECRFLQNGDCFVNLNGDFNSKENNPNRNYIGIVKSNFIRIPCDNKYQISLKSLKTHEDFFKEINMYFSGQFEYTTINKLEQSNEKQFIIKTYMYNIMEIKNSIKNDNRISIFVENDFNFDEMIKLSKLRKLEKKIEEKRIIKLEDFLTTNSTEIKNLLNTKMTKFAENEEYEKANTMKKNLELFSEKFEILKNTNKKFLTRKDFIDKCHI